jgi:hypothetical protein
MLYESRECLSLSIGGLLIELSEIFDQNDQENCESAMTIWIKGLANRVLLVLSQSGTYPAIPSAFIFPDTISVNTASQAIADLLSAEKTLSTEIIARWKFPATAPDIT